MRTHISKIALALIALISILYLTSSWTESTGPDQPIPKVFELLSETRTGITFNNVVVEDNSKNFYSYQYFYNGGGVATGDINNDGLADIYFTGNMSQDRLYINKGGMQFQDITATSGIAGFEGWKTGVTMCDVNQDGKLDIYVSRSGWYEDPELRRNLLFINQGNNKFKEEGAKYGLDDPGQSVQAAFFDYDLDGDMDMYLANHPATFRQMLKDRLEKMKNPSDYESDRLYRNNGAGKFEDVSAQSGIRNYGHGLGLGIADLNLDGYPDVYVSNDFQTPDYYYVNNKNGTFTNRLEESFPHVSYFSMGCDIADFNNDGLVDLFTAEMLAEDNKRQKTNMAPMNPGIFWHLVDLGFHYQMMRNSLQVNRGVGPSLTAGGRFSEIGWQSGVAQTDWSWGALFADFNLDGLKDLYITNGYLRDTQDKDFAMESNKLSAESGGKLDFSQLAPLLPTTKLHNYMYENNNSYQFTDRSEAWGVDFYGFSHGVAYADLDNDGDLDLIVNNTNDFAHIYESKAIDAKLGSFLKIKLKGPQGNLLGLGTKITVKTSKGIQFQEFQITRGFQSSVEPVLHFGLANDEEIENIIVQWPDGKKQFKDEIVPGSTLTIDWKESKFEEARYMPDNSLFQRSGISPVNFIHVENEFDDYEKEVLLPHKQSQHGPRITVGDINGDGIDDCYIGGAAGQAGGLYQQQVTGKFKFINEQDWGDDAACEDLDAVFFDADGDGDNDLYVVSGGNEFAKDSPLLQDRLYLNDGNGSFKKSSGALPAMLTSGGCVDAGDYDGDGDMDLFVGGRLVPGEYPFAPRSYILNNKAGKFTDVTNTVAPILSKPGLITDAIWSDFNGDNAIDLVITGEWMPVLFMQNKGGKLTNITPTSGVEDEKGWWFSLAQADLDKDGDMDFIVGNLGNNYKYQASKTSPFHVFCHDFDGSGTLDIVLGYNNGGTCYPVRGLQCSSQQVPDIKKKFPKYSQFGEATIEDVYGDKLKDALHYEVNNFSSSWIENLGNGKFAMKSLPAEAQFAPMMGIVADDFNGDGIMDLVTAGNLFVSEVETGRADAGNGLVLLGSQQKTFTPLSLAESGFYAPGDVRHLNYMKIGGKPSILVANNNDAVTVYYKK